MVWGQVSLRIHLAHEHRPFSSRDVASTTITTPSPHQHEASQEYLSIEDVYWDDLAPYLPVGERHLARNDVEGDSRWVEEAHPESHDHVHDVSSEHHEDRAPEDPNHTPHSEHDHEAFLFAGFFASVPATVAEVTTKRVPLLTFAEQTARQVALSPSARGPPGGLA